MKLSEDQLKQLEARCDAALKRKTFKGQMRAMGAWMSVDIKALPKPMRAKFRRVLRAIAWTTIMGSVPDRSRR
jgi:hypothetical protein